MPTITETVREIALSQPSSMRVFEQFGIDYCCGGQKPLAVACNEQDVEVGSRARRSRQRRLTARPGADRLEQGLARRAGPATSSRSTMNM